MFKLLREKLKNVFGKFKKDIDEKIEKEAEQIEEKEKVLEQKEKDEESKKEEIERAKISENNNLKELDKKIEKLKEEIREIKKEEKEIKEEIKNIPLDKKESKGFFKIIGKFTTTKLNEEDFDKFFERLEMILLENNVALSVIDSLRSDLKREFVGKTISKKETEEKVRTALKDSLSKILIEPFDLLERIKSKQDKPFVIAFFGINGSGKTTTIAKITHLLKKNGFKCVLAASDTFRAASIEQLERHAEKLNVNVIKHQYGADPAAVAFDAVNHAKAAGLDVVLVDTAGRMHTKADLMREMEKIIRVVKPDLKIFIGESITGNDATEQANAFNKAVGIDGIILTKADVDEKGGAMISVSKVTSKPILYLGIGQKYSDLEKFDREKLIKNLLD